MVLKVLLFTLLLSKPHELWVAAGVNEEKLLQDAAEKPQSQNDKNKSDGKGQNTKGSDTETPLKKSLPNGGNRPGGLGGNPSLKRVAILNFDYAPVQSDVYAIFGKNQDVGKGIADLLTVQLGGDGRYIVVDQNTISKILSEQNFSNSEKLNSENAARIGKILGVDAIVVGTVTRFGVKKKSTSWVGWGKLGGIGNKQSKAEVDISAQVIDISTGEILVAVDGDGESKRSGSTDIGPKPSGKFDMGSSDFQKTILGEAVVKAVGSLSMKLDNSASRLPAHVRQYAGKVADVKDEILIINIGGDNGVQAGDSVEIMRSERTITDPLTGPAIKTIKKKIGEGTVVQVDEKTATVKFSGSRTVNVGDDVTLTQ